MVHEPHPLHQHQLPISYQVVPYIASISGVNQEEGRGVVEEGWVGEVVRQLADDVLLYVLYAL